MGELALGADGSPLTPSATPSESSSSSMSSSLSSSTSASSSSSSLGSATSSVTPSPSSSITLSGSGSLLTSVTSSVTPSITPTFTPTSSITKSPSQSISPTPSLSRPLIPTVTLFAAPNPGLGGNINGGDVKGYCQSTTGPYPSCLVVDAWMCYNGSPMTTLATRLGLPNSVPVYGLKSTAVLTQITPSYTDLLSSSVTPVLLSTIGGAIDPLVSSPWVGCNIDRTESPNTCKNVIPLDTASGGGDLGNDFTTN